SVILRITASLSFLYTSRNLYPHSFPTRRSSDLQLQDSVATSLPMTDVAEEMFARASRRYGAESAELFVAKYLEDDTGLSFRIDRSEEHTSELQSRFELVYRLLPEKKKNDEQKTK